MDDLPAGRSFDSEATRVIGVLDLFFFDKLSMFLYNQALADVRTTGTGIKCLYYSSSLCHSCLIKKYEREGDTHKTAVTQ